MATKSILKSLTIKDNESCRKLLNALDNSKARPRRDTAISKTTTRVTDPDDIRKIFGDAKNQLNIYTIKTTLTPIFEKYGVKKAVLFGSFAKNTMTEKSDIDLLVDSGLKGLKFVGFTEDIQNAISRPADVFDVTHIENGSEIEKEISRHGKVIFDRTDK